MSDLTGPDVAPATSLRRPPVIWFLSIIVLVVAALALLGGLALLSDVNDQESHGRSVNAAVRFVIVIGLACSVAQAGGAVLLFLGRGVGRYAVMAVAGLVILSNLVSLLAGNGIQGCVGIVVNGAIVASMMRQDVRDWCDR